MDTIITRFPPSPTGYLHIGGARTALFNWLWARKNKGRFVLRIEDTDTVRSTKESVDAIFDSLNWLGIDWDEGPFFQTERYPLYREYIQRLIDSGHAYYCSCTPDEVDAMREEARANGHRPMYNKRCRDLDLGPGPNRVVRLKVPGNGSTVVEDIVKGPTSFQNSEIDDFIILRSDNSPTYNLAVVVDDLTMGINTILRGDDHLVNTPKQILIYRALGAELPLFGHVPMVLGHDKTRLSKRHGAMSVGEYRAMGILPDAMINYLVRLGWSHGDQEFFTREELIEKFSLEHLGRSASMFDMDKLMALNAKHIQSKSNAEIALALTPYLAAKGVTLEDYSSENSPSLELVVESLKPRSKTLVEMAEASLFYFVETLTFDDKAVKKFLKPEIMQTLSECADGVEALGEFTQPALEGLFEKVMEKYDLKFGKIAQPLRVALTGKTVSPGIFEMILALGRKKTVDRIRAVIK